MKRYSLWPISRLWALFSKLHIQRGAIIEVTAACYWEDKQVSYEKHSIIKGEDISVSKIFETEELVLLR